LCTRLFRQFTYADQHAVASGHADRDEDPDGDQHLDTDGDSHGDPYAHVDPYAHGHPAAHQYEDADTDAKRPRDANRYTSNWLVVSVAAQYSQASLEHTPAPTQVPAALGSGRRNRRIVVVGDKARRSDFARINALFERILGRFDLPTESGRGTTLTLTVSGYRAESSPILEENEMQIEKGRVARMALLATIFAVGFFCGSITQRRADAQIEELGKEAIQKAGGSGGVLGSAVELGNAIVDMQQHVNGLQKNLDTLKKVKSSLGG